MHTVNTQRITITLPNPIAETVRTQAKRSKRPISSIIAEALVNQEEERMERLMIEGYKEFAELNLQLAEEFWPIAGETLPDESWPDD